MSDDEDYNSEEDFDYVPSDGEKVSEEENSGEEEDFSLLGEDGESGVKAGAKRKKQTVKKKDVLQPRKRKGGIKLEEAGKDEGESLSAEQKDETEEEAKRKKELAEQIAQEEASKRIEKEKKRADDLWSSFMSDVKKPPKRPASSSSGASGLCSLSGQVQPTKPEARTGQVETEQGATASAQGKEKSGKVTITKVFDFAGEEIKITEEVDASSKEAMEEQKRQEKASQEQTQAAKSSPLTAGSSLLQMGLKRPAASGGLGSVLSKITKKNKMGTLDKSKLDWNSFKKKEGIEEDLKIHNKGKQGYTERMDFLNRADYRQYEIERDLRLGTNSKR